MYFGEIAEYGDTVKIMNEPTINVSDYTRGEDVVAQWLDDDELTLTIDTAKKFSFAVDDIEKKHAHHNWEALATSSGAYALKNSYDQNILSAIASGSTTNVVGSDSTTKTTNLGATSGSIDLGFDAGERSPLALMSRMGRLLDDDDVPEEGRWFVAAPDFWEQMADENSKLMGVDFTGDSDSKLRNGRVTDGMIRGFRCYKSNNLPATDNTTGQVIAGHMSAVATASQIAKTESFRSQDFFGDVVRGLHLYGKKVLRETALAKAFYTIDN